MKTGWKEILVKLTEPLKNSPILAFALLIVAFIAFLGGLITTQDRPWMWLVVFIAMVIYAGSIFFQGGPRAKETQPTIPPEPDPTSSTPAVAPGGQPVPETAPKSAPAPSFSEAQEAYLRAVIADCRLLRLDVLDEHAGDPNAVRLSLEDVYIDLNTTASLEEKENKRSGMRQASSGNNLSRCRCCRPWRKPPRGAWFWWVFRAPGNLPLCATWRCAWRRNCAAGSASWPGLIRSCCRLSFH